MATALAAAGVTLTALADLIRRATLEPALTGPLLLALTRGPPWLQEYLLRPLNKTRVQKDQLVKILKLLLALGVVRRTNNLLNKLALNHWRKDPTFPLKPHVLR